MAATAEGATAQDIYEKGVKLGDQVTPEAYHNLGRRLEHRGLVTSRKKDGRTHFSTAIEEEMWFDEDDIAEMIDPEYPIPSLVAEREISRQLQDIPEEQWVIAREQLLRANARGLFKEAIISYANNLRLLILDYTRDPFEHNSNSVNAIEKEIRLLDMLCKDGLGLSDEAIKLPLSAKNALEAGYSIPEQFYDSDILSEELDSRIEEGMFLRYSEQYQEAPEMIIAGVDGSSSVGLLTPDGATGDFVFGASPILSIITAVSRYNRLVSYQGAQHHVTQRLPVKPEDMQRQDNQFSYMAKMFCPDLSDSEYMHSVWAAMDLMETRVTATSLSIWNHQIGNIEIPPAEIVFRDGTIVPNDRDPIHYSQQNTYGQIVRRLIERNWQVCVASHENSQTICGTVKNAQMRVFAPVIDFLLSRPGPKGDIRPLKWPLNVIGHIEDQKVLSRILTAGREHGDPWIRTALVLRPFHAASNLGKQYSRQEGKKPHEKLIAKIKMAQEKSPLEVTPEENGWRMMRPEGDPYIKMLQNVWYAGFYLGTFRRLDGQELLPRMEFLVKHSTEESGTFPAKLCNSHLTRILTALATVGFDADNEHDMFAERGRIDLLPYIIIQAHETAKSWAKEMLGRVNDVMDLYLARFRKDNGKSKVKIRPWKKAELNAWIETIKQERREIGGGRAIGIEEGSNDDDF